MKSLATSDVSPALQDISSVIANEAKQSRAAQDHRLDCFVAYAPRNDSSEIHRVPVAVQRLFGIAPQSRDRHLRRVRWTPDQQCITPQERPAALHPGNVKTIHLKKEGPHQAGLRIGDSQSNRDQAVLV
jgi:hypothetical protein